MPSYACMMLASEFKPQCYGLEYEQVVEKLKDLNLIIIIKLECLEYEQIVENQDNMITAILFKKEAFAFTEILDQFATKFKRRIDIGNNYFEVPANKKKALKVFGDITIPLMPCDDDDDDDHVKVIHKLVH